MSGTILDNILMGRGSNNEFLDRAIESSAFPTDLKLMNSGLQTEVGERALLSGDSSSGWLLREQFMVTLSY